MEPRDNYNEAHCLRVGEMSTLIGERMRLSSAEIDLIGMAACVHDIGKLGVSPDILQKPGDLTDVEWSEIRNHPEIGARIVGRSPLLRPAREIVLSHHERWDGRGYPRGLRGEAIPREARVIAVADAWDAMVSHRVYRLAMDLDDALGEMKNGRGTQFDPVALDAFLALLKDQPHLLRQHTEPTPYARPAGLRLTVA